MKGTPMSDDEMLRQAIQMSRDLSRRRFLRNAGMAAGGLVLSPALLAACGDDTKSTTATTNADSSTDAVRKVEPDTGTGIGGKSVTFSNWETYIDTGENDNASAAGTTIDRFQKETGITMDYKVDFNDNDEYFNKIFSPNLGTGKPIDPDVVAPSYWMAARLLGLGWLEKLPMGAIPNHKNLADQYLNLSWDDGAAYHMPWQAGITGIAYDPSRTGFEIKSFKDLFDDRLEGKISLLKEVRDTVGCAMLDMGKDPSKPDLDGAMAALDFIDEMRGKDKIRQFTGNEYLQPLSNGDVKACLAWSGDIVQLQRKQPNLKFVIPEAGSIQWFDTMVIPKGAKNTNAVAQWMNFVYDVDNAALITEFVQYVSPVKGVREALEAKGGDTALLAESQVLFPDDATQKRLKIFASLPQKDELAIQERFNNVKGA